MKSILWCLDKLQNHKNMKCNVSVTTILWQFNNL